jgi:hypothetical protein
MQETLLLRFDGHPFTVELARDQATELEKRLRDATADPGSHSAADKIKAVLTAEGPHVTFAENERASLVAVLALALPDIDEPLRQLYLGVRDEARAEQE